MFDRGYFQVARWRNIPLRVHWSMPLGALLFGGLQLAPAFWLGFVVLIGAHELGHALLVRRYGHRVEAIDLTGFGGLTRWSGYATDVQRSVIAWGGVMAQAVLLLVAVLAIALFGFPRGGAAADLASVFTRTNLWLMLLNLLPVPPFDGAHAWRLLSHLPNPLASLRARVARATSRGKSAKPSSPPKSGTSSASAAQPPQGRELADMLDRIGREARRARRPD